MKGDIGFVGFMLTADEWQELDADSRAALIAVATRRMEALTPPPSARLRTETLTPPARLGTEALTPPVRLGTEALTPPAQLRTDPVAPLPTPPRRMPDGTGKHEILGMKHEILDMIDPDLDALDEADLDELLEPDPDMEAAIRDDEANHAELAPNGDVVSETVDATTGDFEDFADWAEL